MLWKEKEVSDFESQKLHRFGCGDVFPVDQHIKANKF